jgi:hypothetical protein
VLVLVGSTAVAVALVAVAFDLPSRLGPQPPVTVSTDRPGLAAHTSPALAVHPTRPAVVAVAARIDSPRYSCSVAVSTTGGTTWRPLQLPLPADAPNCFWPDVAFDGGGNLLVLYTATAGRYSHPAGVWLQRFSGPGDSPEGPPVEVAGAMAFHAHLAASGQKAVVAWVQARPENNDQPLGLLPPPNPLLAARSTDGGRTFGPPVTVEPARAVVQPAVVLGEDGQAVVLAFDLSADPFNYEAQHEGQGGAPPEGTWGVLAWRSTDGGATFGAAVPVATGLVVPDRVVVDLMRGPSLAREPGTPRLYAAWDAGRGDDRDVHVARSDDGGATWTPEPARLRRPRSQLLPAVAAAHGGRVDLVFFDRSADPADVRTEVVVASSWDGGRTFSTAVVSEAPFDAAIGLGGPQGIPQRGNQLAIHSFEDRALAAWGDASVGTVDDIIQDLVVAAVDVGPEPRVRWPLVVLGGLVALAGTVVAARLRTGARSAP